jgi:hypothetical protein
MESLELKRVSKIYQLTNNLSFGVEACTTELILRKKEMKIQNSQICYLETE